MKVILLKDGNYVDTWFVENETVLDVIKEALDNGFKEFKIEEE